MQLESLQNALSHRELQSSELSIFKEIKSPSDKSKSVTNKTSTHAQRLSTETSSIDRREKPQVNKLKEAKLVRTASAVITPSPRRLSLENRSTQKVEKSSSVRRLSTGTSNLVELGKAQETKGRKYVYEKAEAISEKSSSHSRRLSSERCSTGKYAKTAYLEDQKVLKTPSVHTRTRRLSLEGHRCVNKDFVDSDKSGLSAISASKPKALTSKGDFRPEASRQMALKSPSNRVFDSQVVRHGKERKVPSLEPTETPEAVYARSQLIEPSESQTASMKGTASGKTSQIRKSLRAIGKLIDL